MGVERDSQRKVAQSRLLLCAVLLVAVATGCSPKRQSTVVRDPVSGRPMLVVALCAGERVDAVRVRQGSDDSAPVVWEVQRSGGSDVRQVVLGSVPDGFTSTIGSTGDLPASGWAEVSLSGGGAARSGSPYDAAAVSELTQETLDDLNGMALDNCSQVPARASWWLTIGALVAGVGVFVVVVRRVRAPSRRLAPRPAVLSPWAYLTAVMVFVAAVVIGSGSFGRQRESSTYLLIGTLLSVVALALGLLGRLARRLKWADWLLIVPGLVFALIAGLLATMAGGMFGSCGTGWTFDCTTSLSDRLVVLGCLGPAWAVTVWTAEGGRWPRILPTRHEHREPDETAVGA